MNVDDTRYLSWFLGPKAENSELFLNCINTIIQDYIHWRRNYYPDDNTLISKKMQRNFLTENDMLSQNIIEMMSMLRRNFPFYSPRYFAHMLSDITLPSTLGYFAAMLYNANNVTPEASPVAVEWEIEACNEILKMIGFKPSPVPPTKEDPIAAWENYQKELKEEFGWAHITSGGTVANIEAIWVARIVKYFPLAVRDIAIKKNIEILIKRPNKSINDIRKLSKEEVINIKPNESIFLYAKLITALSEMDKITLSEASSLSSRLLSESEYSVSGNWGKIFSEFPPVLFTSGAAHYSVKKAADILGIGKDSVVIVDTDAYFRMSTSDLENKIWQAIKSGKYPVAVVGVGATTEEGAVDPIHEIVALREKLESTNKSFWLHVDSAWGGYINSLFIFDEEEEFVIILNKISAIFSSTVKVESADSDNLSLFIEGLKSGLIRNLSNERDFTAMIDNSFSVTEKNKLKVTSIKEHEKRIQSFDSQIEDLKSLFLDGEPENIPNIKKQFLIRLKVIIINNMEFVYVKHRTFKKITAEKLDTVIKDSDVTKISLLAHVIDRKNSFTIEMEEVIENTPQYVSDHVVFEVDNYKVGKNLNWGEGNTIAAFLSFKHADSVTIDPHKLGYIQYPCGVVSFRNDRVRHLITQRAPYITSSMPNYLVHNPPRHVKNLDFSKLTPKENELKKLPYNEYKIGIDAFAPFMLEGSKPGAAAAALWLSSKVIPLNRKNHGLIIKSSLIAARELYEWLFTWHKIAKEGMSVNPYYEFKTFGSSPDTNVVVFAIKNRFDDTVEGMNALTKLVYKKFAIEAELGSREHSYNQPFFLSKTEIHNDYYKYKSFKKFFDDCDLRDSESDYINKGLVLLRATVMNPYITPIRQYSSQNLIKEFILELHKTANEASKSLIK